MKVLYLVPPGRGPGQLSPYSFLDEEIEGLADAGIRPIVLSNSDEGEATRGPIQLRTVPPGRWRERARIPRLLSHYSDAVPFRSPGRLRKAFHAMRLELSAAKLVRSRAVDLIHSHFGCAFGLGGLVAARETHRPLVASFRGMDILVDDAMDYGLRRDRSFDRGVRALLRRADITTYATDFMRDTAIRMGADERTAVTIRKGVDLEHFQACAHREGLRLSLGFTRPMILTVADLIPRKGIDVILRALAPLRNTYDFDFVVCGKGPEAMPLRRLARQLGLADRTHFLGWVSREEIPEYFSACDVLILASHLEAAGNVLLEAMAAARPVVCTDSGGPPEYVRDGVSGFVIPPDNPLAMAGRIRKLLEEPELGDRMGRAGREIAERDYRYDRMIAEYVEVYRRARNPRTGAASRGNSDSHSLSPLPAGARSGASDAGDAASAAATAGGPS